jgi:Notch-like protein
MPNFRLASRRSLRIASAIVLVSVGLASSAHAVVEQIDGRVMPLSVDDCPESGDATGCVQVALNIGEGLDPDAIDNPLSAINDAQTSPEVFAIPQSNGVYGSVTARDMVEGAGYENSFGWYNVDDPDTLHVVTPCADEPGSQRTVDFQVEFDEGRYAGGFIGFFLITPEDQPDENNCGSVGNEGHVYFTEAAKNGDGNYVHYLIYTSKVDSRRFYFGFEDLFRGGDNDFEDMFLQVDGLVLPCVPSSEVCDGADNNCDGLIDNDPVDAGGPCGLTDVGECELGVLECQDGDLECIGEVGPVPEQCNGLDDDCDLVVDDDPAGANDECGDDTGECSFGSQTCVGGVFVCLGGTGPAAEVCDLLDNDCNGETDDDPLDAGGNCGSNIGECEPGILICNDEGEVVCDGGVGPTDEICDGLDNDCNGAVDDGNPGGGAACGSDEGICDPGIEFCIGGEIECIGGVGPSEEVCDGLDNDCDGEADLTAECPNGSQCVEGTCASPCGDGEFPCPGGQVCTDGFCLEGTCDDVECEEGEVCQSGICVPESAGEGGAGATTTTTSAEAATGSGTTTTSASSAGTGAGDGGGASDDGAGDNFGLATGGSGLRCAAAAPGTAERSVGAASLFALIAVAIGARRRRRRAATDATRAGEVKR